MADHVSKEIFCREFFFQKSSFSISALGIERTFSVISTEVCRPFVSTVFCLSIGPVSGEQMFVQTFFYNIYGHSAKICLFFSENLSVNLTKLHSTSPEENLNTKHCFGKDVVCFFHVLPKLNGEIMVFFVKNTFGKFVTFAYHVSKNIFWRSFFWKSSFFSSLGIEQLLYVISTKFCPSRCQYCFLFVNSISLWWKNFCLIIFSPSITDIDRKLISLCSNFFGQVDDTGFYESKVSIWRKKNVLTNLCLFHLSFADLEQKNQGFFRKTIGSVVKMADHVSKEIFCREFFSKKFFFYFSIGHWANVFCHFDGSLSVPLSVLFSVCQLDQFLVNKCLSKLFSTTFTDIQQKFVCFFPKIFRST